MVLIEQAVAAIGYRANKAFRVLDRRCGEVNIKVGGGREIVHLTSVSPYVVDVINDNSYLLVEHRPLGSRCLRKQDQAQQYCLLHGNSGQLVVIGNRGR